MALTNRDGRCFSEVTAFMHRVLLTGVIVTGLFATGCGGSSEAPATPAASSSDAGSTDLAMSEASMSNANAMHGGPMPVQATPASTDESMQRAMDSGAAAGIGDTSESHGEGSDASADATRAAMMTPGSGEKFGDTSESHGEGSSAPSDAQRAAMMAAAGESGQAGDPALGQSVGSSAPSDAQRAAMMAAGENSGPDSSGNDAAMAAQMAAANGQPDPGNPGGSRGGQAQAPPADSPDYPAFKIVMGLMQGEHEGLKDLVATRGRGLIEKLRSGSLTTEEKDELKKTFAQPQLVGTPRTIRGSRTVTLNSAGQVITLVSKKQGADWKVSSISIKAAQKR